MSTLKFADPFERLLTFAQNMYGVSAEVAFVRRSELPRVGLFRRAKGTTFFPNGGGVPEIRIDGGLRRGVAGTLDILAHELAHAVAGPDAEHGPEWQRVYAALYEAACEQPFVWREIGSEHPARGSDRLP